MLPLYFGPADAPLFGAFHAPEAAARSTGVLLCQPLGHEYIRAHRTFNQLAAGLARAGFPVFRFDYFGTGDSSGADELASVSRWMADVNTAIDELKDTASVPNVAVLGLRLGASIALAATRQRRDVTRLVLWDPVLDGRVYLAELERLQRQWLKGRPGSRLFTFRPAVEEIFGFPLPRQLRQEIETLDVSAAVPPGVRVDVVGSLGHEEFAPWVAALQARHAGVHWHELPVHGDWTEPDQVHVGVMPAGVLQHLSALMSGRPA